MTNDTNTQEKFLPLGEPTLRFPPPERPDEVKENTPAPAAFSGVPSQKQQQWGVVISIAIIVLMIIIGAFYSWGKRIAEENALIESLPVSE